jgi:hypothetical protein
VDEGFSAGMVCYNLEISSPQALPQCTIAFPGAERRTHDVLGAVPSRLLVSRFRSAIQIRMIDDKNLLWDRLNIYNKGSCMSRRKKSEEKNHNIWGAFSSHPGETWTKSFRSGMRVTKDRTFILTSRQKGVFYPLLRANQPLAPSIRTRSTVHSAQIGIHRVIRVHVEGIRG